MSDRMITNLQYTKIDKNDGICWSNLRNSERRIPMAVMRHGLGMASHGELLDQYSHHCHCVHKWSNTVVI